MNQHRQPLDLIIKKVKKGWGNEEWLVNNEKYCAKFLNFKKKCKFSMHYHIIKDETWYIMDGEFILKWINTINAECNEKKLIKGDIIRVLPNLIHQLECTTEIGKILEISTEHTDIDNYRVMPGDSQTLSYKQSSNDNR